MQTLPHTPDHLVDGGHQPGTPGELAAAEALRAQVRIELRPIASPSTIGMFGLAAGTFVLAGLQLGWVPENQSRQIALALMAFAFISQFYASIVATLARDGVVATAMAVLSLTWFVVGLELWFGQPGATSKALGLLLIVSCVTMAVIGLTAGKTKLVPATVFLVASLRFGLTALYELTSNDSWKTATGITGLVLAMLAVYTGWAFLMESAAKRTVLPLGRRALGTVAVQGSLLEQIQHTAHEPGVRTQL